MRYAKFLESLISAHMEREAIYEFIIHGSFVPSLTCFEASVVSAAEADLLMLRLEASDTTADLCKVGEVCFAGFAWEET